MHAAATSFWRLLFICEVAMRIGSAVRFADFLAAALRLLGSEAYGLGWDSRAYVGLAVPAGPDRLAVAGGIGSLAVRWAEFLAAALRL